jgi:RES domain-containing protein
VTFSHLRRGGTYYRVCDRSWTDPSDTSFAKTNGGRWNPPDRPGRPGFGALYLNLTLEVARANARRHVLASFGAMIDDLVDDKHRPDLQRYEVVEADFAVPHPPCQGIAEAAYAQAEHGIVPLSAASPVDEELVIFDRDVAALAVKTTRLTFATWY